MNETAMFADDERKWIRDDEGNILYLRTTPSPRKCLAAQLEALPEPSQEFVLMTKLMALIKVRKPTEGKDECKTTKSMNCSDQKLSTSSQPNQTTNSKSIIDSEQCLNGNRITDGAPVEL